MTKRIINLRVNPGEATDGSGQVCIHLFVRDEKGPFVETCVMTISKDEPEMPDGKKVLGSARGRLACSMTRTVMPVTHKGVTTLTSRSDDPRAVTCPKCKATAEYATLMKLLEGR